MTQSCIAILLENAMMCLVTSNLKCGALCLLQCQTASIGQQWRRRPLLNENILIVGLFI